MKRWCIVAAWVVATLGAQEIDLPAGLLPEGDGLPPAPRDGVFDEARLFRTSPERRILMEERLREFREGTGYEVYVAFLESLIGRNLDEECQRLRLAWLGEKPGMVFAMNTDSGDFATSWSEPSIRAGGDELPAVGPGEVSPTERKRIEGLLESQPAPGVRSSEGAEQLVLVLLDGLEEAVASAEAPVHRRGRLLLLALGLGSVMLLVAMLAGAAVRRGDRRAQDRLYFPKIEVGERLKAPRGGGKVSSRSFGVSSS